MHEKRKFLPRQRAHNSHILGETEEEYAVSVKKKKESFTQIMFTTVDDIKYVKEIHYLNAG